MKSSAKNIQMTSYEELFGMGGPGGTDELSTLFKTATLMLESRSGFGKRGRCLKTGSQAWSKSPETRHFQ